LGILGAGGIAGHFASASPASIDIVAIGSRDQAKADAFAAKHNIGKAYGSYAAVVEDKDIDAVYIALPNGLHKEWAIKCAKAGKHVLCEKPMALSRADAEEMFEEAANNKVVLIEAFPFRFQPQTQEVLRTVHAGDLGEIITVTGCFGFRMRDPNNVRMDPTQGAGTTWDVGVYPLNVVRAVMGRPPKSVFASARFDHNGVDLTACAILEYDDGRQASIWSSFESATFRRANIVGSDGAIDYSHNNHPMTTEAASFLLQRGQGKEMTEEIIQNLPGNGFVLEANAFAELATNPTTPFFGTTRQETLDNIATVEAVLKSAKLGKAIAVSAHADPTQGLPLRR
jgi:predicted dehydrogenase